ncbi:hypothetical protein Q9Q95_14435 [Sphingomonas sp. DG1-23]|jgi:hypothetical protein|uniref:DUF6894 family protein n=1 Tax=Sphingomonas sp. DG1-23 TaxID=3068316 RepID=UPI00273EE16C|nr:hypothetical protein [Sphingomonas sp. DG1-23]MDP5280124.1 hypothetical protein [Sphingomonas sp. DG1-23]
MVRYYLHLEECGTLTEDREGVELADAAFARELAVRAARDVMSHEVKHGRLCLSCTIVISDAAGRELERMPFKDALTLTGI